MYKRKEKKKDGYNIMIDGLTREIGKVREKRDGRSV